MSEFISLYASASRSAGNMASCIGILTSITREYERTIESIIKDPSILKNSYYLESLTSSLEIQKKHRMMADYFWDHRTEEDLNFEKVREIIFQEPSKVA